MSSAWSAGADTRNVLVLNTGTGAALLEGGEVVTVEARGERLPDLGLGRLAGHEPKRERPAADPPKVRVLGEAQVEKGAAGEGIDQRLDDAAHARGHAAGEHAER